MTLRDFDSTLFEYLSRGRYKFLGPDHKYNGNTYLYSGDSPYLLIGTWNKGKFQFAISEIMSFSQWKKANFPGVFITEIINISRTLKVVDAGNGRRRLGLTQADHKENQSMAPAKNIKISLNPFINNYINIRAIRTYVRHGSITHNDVNRWIIDNNYELGKEFRFKFCVKGGGTHIYKLIK